MACQLAVMLTALSVLLPLLERDRVGRSPVLETEHHTGSCVVAHDHTICTQVGANFALAAPGAQPAPAEGRLQRLTGLRVHEVPSRTFSTGHRSRAPPLVRA